MTEQEQPRDAAYWARRTGALKIKDVPEGALNLNVASLATHSEVNEQVKVQKVCVDPKVQWSRVGNVWHNASARSVLHAMAATRRWVRGLTRYRNLRCPTWNASPREDSSVI